MYTALFLSCLLVSSLAGPAQSIGSIGGKSSSSFIPPSLLLPACLSGMCPPGYDCVSDSCVVRRVKRAVCSGEILGACLDGLCPEGYACDGVNCC